MNGRGCRDPIGGTPVSAAFKPLVLIPSYNPGAKGLETAIRARKVFEPVWWISDGSTDASDAEIESHFRDDPGFRLLRSPRNQGKGAAVYRGLIDAVEESYTHVLTMDADGQHPSDRIQDFIAASKAHPEAMILGVPVFGEDAPSIRVKGRKISNGWVNIETLGAGVGDSLFGFRVYPIQALFKIMQNHRSMRRFDFDPEAVVRLSWSGIKPINIECKVRYPSAAEGGVSHFRYGRDNVILTWMHFRLMAESVIRLPLLLWRRHKALPQG